VNNNKGKTFSKRFGYGGEERPITVREDAPYNFRYAVIAIAIESTCVKPSTLRSIICRVLREPPDTNNWTEYPNVWNEVQDLIYGSEWHRVYDIIEAVYDFLKQCDLSAARTFEQSINDYFRENGVGWKLVDGITQTRGEEAFEKTVATASEALEESGLATSKQELTEAIQDLSRRPKPDLSGAVHHAMAALECVARDVSGDPKKTLGEIIKQHEGLVPKPLDDAVSKIWGHSSEVARHAREERSLEREEAQLVVGLAATVATYLSEKARANNKTV